MRGLVNFLFEAGMLKKTPRTGYQFLGSGSESVADHSFRTTIIGYILSLEKGEVDTLKVLLMCVFHDIAEARTGDRNYLNKRYVKVDEELAISDLTKNLDFGDKITSLLKEFNMGETMEAKIARDADQLDLILELKEQLDLGNRYASEWLRYSMERLKTEEAKKLADEILKTDSTEWWFEKKRSLWVDD